MKRQTDYQTPAQHGDVRIRVQNLSYRYEKALSPALRDISFEIGSGEYVSILGANGSGKSTLLKCINGICPPAPGMVLVFDRDGQGLDSSDDASLRSIRQIAGTVLQNPDDQIISSVVEEDVAFGPENLGLPEEEIWARVNRALENSGLEDLRNKPPQFLSGGERQRLAIAGILALEGEVIALDEAASMIDPAGREKLLSLLQELSSRGKTVLQVTHSLEEAFQCRRCMVLHKGSLVFDGKPEDLLSEERLDEWGFRLPDSIKTIRELMKRFPGFSVSSLKPEESAAALSSFLEKRDNPPGRGSSPPDFPDGSVSKTAVQFNSVSHEFLRGTAFAASGIADVSCRIPENCTLAFIGITGSGKSTVLRHINALLLPSKGSVRVLGQNTLDKRNDLRSLRFSASLAIQNPESALFEAYVADDVAYGPKNAGLTGKALVSRVRKSMEQIGLPFEEFKDREIRSLSGGEKRRAAIAGVLALDSSIVLLDEPAAALDGRGQERILKLMESLKKEHKTVVATTHSMEKAGSFDYIAVMKGGRLAAFGSPREIFGAKWDASWGMRLPWTAAVVRKLEELGYVYPGRVPLSSGELLDIILDKEIPWEDTGPQAVSLPPESTRAEGSGAAAEEGGEIPGKYRRKKTGIEFFRNATLGQFLDRPSPLRNLGGGTKLFLLVLCGTFAIAGPNPLYPLAVLILALAAGAAAGRVGPKHLLRGIIPALPYIGLLILLQIIFSWPDDGSRVLFALGPVSFTMNELFRCLSLLARLTALMALLSLYSATTPLRESLRAFNKLLAPLSKIGIPARSISLAVGITLRFVPILTEEAERIAAAQIARGGAFGGKGRIRAAAAMIVPLILRTLERAETIARAMVLRLFRIEEGPVKIRGNPRDRAD